MGKKFIIMCVGITHTGKTTFAKKLAQYIQDLVVVDNDEVSLFLNDKYRAAVLSPYNKIKRTFREPNLKFLISRDILKFCLRAGLNVVQASSNLGKDIRLLIKNDAKKYGYTLVTVYFNLPKDIILKRVKHSRKDTKSLWRSKNWAEVLEKHKKHAELPPSRKSTLYFEIKNDEDYKKVFLEVERVIG